MPCDSYIYALEAADKYLDTMPSDPLEDHRTLVHVIMAAMIAEFEALKRSQCPKCRASYSQKRHGGDPMKR